MYLWVNALNILQRVVLHFAFFVIAFGLACSFAVTDPAVMYTAVTVLSSFCAEARTLSTSLVSMEKTMQLPCLNCFEKPFLIIPLIDQMQKATQACGERGSIKMLAVRELTVLYSMKFVSLFLYLHCSQKFQQYAFNLFHNYIKYNTLSCVYLL